MSIQIERLAEQLARCRKGGPGQGVRYPEELRVAAGRLAQEQLEAGQALSSLAQQLGIAPATLERWRAVAPAGRFRRVEVVEAAGLEVDTERVLTLVTPSGYRIEGLSPTQAAELVGQLDARQ